MSLLSTGRPSNVLADLSMAIASRGMGAIQKNDTNLVFEHKGTNDEKNKKI